jgi:hypothetical protein
VQTISYLNTDQLEAVRNQADEGQAAQRAHHGLLASAGFSTAHNWETGGRVRYDMAQLLYPELTGRRLRMWRHFLPTEVDPERHNFDTPPTEALEHISTARGLACFDRIMVWTPEGSGFFGRTIRWLEAAAETVQRMTNQIDPMAVGIVRDRDGVDHYFQITRWGESLKSIGRIRREVWVTNMQIRLIYQVMPLLLTVIGFIGYSRAIGHFGFWPVIGVTVVSCAGLAFAAGIASDGV